MNGRDIQVAVTHCRVIMRSASRRARTAASFWGEGAEDDGDVDRGTSRQRMPLAQGVSSQLVRVVADVVRLAQPELAVGIVAPSIVRYRCARARRCAACVAEDDVPPGAFRTGARQFCGGIAMLPCPDGMICMDDPNDGCDLAAGDADCGGVCMPPRGTPACDEPGAPCCTT